MTEPPNSQPKFRQKLMLSVAFAVLVGFILSAVYLHLATSRLAKSETLILGDSLTLQSELLIRPLVLSNDRISLNYLLNELVQLDHLNGLQVQDKNGVVIARSGNTSDLKKTRRLQQQEKTIGTLTLWLSAAPAEKLISSQHIVIAMLGGLTTLFALFAIWLVSRKAVVVQTEAEQKNSPFDFSETLALQESERSHSQFNDSVEATLAEELHTDAVEQNASELDVEITTTIQEQPDNTPEPTKEETPAEPAHTNTANTASTTPQSEPHHYSPKPTLAEFALTKLAIKEQDQLQTRELVDLLKPEQSSVPQMPKFEHHPQDLEPEPQGPETETLVFEEETAPNSKDVPYQPSMKNPLFKMEEDREEVQLDL